MARVTSRGLNVVVLMTLVGVSTGFLSKAGIRTADYDPCSCINWRDAYNSGLVKCGSGLEYTYTFAHEQGSVSEYMHFMKTMQIVDLADQYLSADYCEAFFTKLDDTVCVRNAMDRAPGMWYDKSWCYVSQSCSMDAPAATKIETYGVKIKMCEKGKDRFLGDMSPPELVAFGKKRNVTTPGIMMRLAYPVDRTIKDIQLQQEELLNISLSKEPIIVDAFNSVVAGDKVFTVPDIHSYENFTCTRGCDDSPASKAAREAGGWQVGGLPEPVQLEEHRAS